MLQPHTNNLHSKILHRITQDTDTVKSHHIAMEYNNLNSINFAHKTQTNPSHKFSNHNAYGTLHFISSCIAAHT